LEPDPTFSESEDATPIFTTFRRGYDPDQVERYVADQRRRLDEATRRASESERKLAAAVGQLRELHRRVAALESSERSDPTPAIDAIGEHIQRILQDAWEGAYAMRQSAERDSTDVRERAASEADSIVKRAHQRAEAVGMELARRRQSMLQSIETERSKSVAQTTFLHDQRKLALSELVKVRSLIDLTIAEFSEPPVASTKPNAAASTRSSTPPQRAPIAREDERPNTPQVRIAAAHPTPTQRDLDAVQHRHPARRSDGGNLPHTLPVHRLPSRDPEMEHDPSSLVRSHRELAAEAPEAATVHEFDPDRRRVRPPLFDFEAGEDN
jgi:cell division septum initiation protein DivIVA